MPTPRHRLTEIDSERCLAVCELDGPVDIRRRWIRGRVEWRCGVKRREERKRENSAAPPRSRESREASVARDPTVVMVRHRRAVADRLASLECERCGFKAVHACQLDVDHRVRRIDGGTDDRENLWVLCANCHRLKTQLEALPGWDIDAFASSGAQTGPLVAY